MNLVLKKNLIKPAGRNRIYEIELVETGGLYLVNYRYGWEGLALEDGTRTPDPVSREEADRILKSLVLSCTERGYFEQGSTGSKAPPAAPVPVETDARNPYDLALLSRLQRLPGLDDAHAAKLLWSLALRRLQEALPRVLDAAGSYQARHHPATCRLLPYVIWRLRDPQWDSDSTDTLILLASSPDKTTSEAAQLVLGEFLGTPSLTLEPAARVNPGAPSADEWIALRTQDKDLFHEQTLALYATGRHDPEAAALCLDVLRVLPFERDSFRTIRRIFKAAEAFDDSSVFGLLAQRFAAEPTPPSYYGRSLVFTGATKSYLNRRVARHLRSLGGFDRTNFVDMASACLMDQRYGLPLHNASFPARDMLLSNGETRFAELWAVAPGHLLEIIRFSHHQHTVRFAARKLRENAEYAARIRLPVLAELFAHPVAQAKELALWVAEHRAAAGLMDIDLLCVLAAQPLEAAQTMVRTTLNLAPETWLRDPNDAARLLLALHPDHYRWLETFLPGAPLDAEGTAKALLDRLQQTAPPVRLTREQAMELPATLRTTLQDGIAQVPPHTFAALADHADPLHRLMAIRLAALRPDGATLFDAQTMAGSDDSDLQASAAALIVGASREVLIDTVDLICALLLGPNPAARREAISAVQRLAADNEGRPALLAVLLDATYHDEPHEGVYDVLAELWGLTAGEADTPSAKALRQGVSDMGPTVIWSLIRARAGLARRLGAEVVSEFSPMAFSLRKIARIGCSDQKIARDWAVNALRTRVDEVARAPQETFALLDGDWSDSRDATYALIRETGAERWPDEAVLALCDCTTIAAQGFGRELLAQRMTAVAAPGFLMRLAEHPAPVFRLTIARLIREYAGDDPNRLRTLIPAMRRMLQRVHASRAAKEQIWRFIEERIDHGTDATRTALTPLVSDMAASVVRADRDRAIAALLRLRSHGLAETTS
ncbi:hypothetical protein [Ruegeria sp. Ofav3-42]|uniref:hypothetical protein n=1 Tax=Ruegeria sp. Ofav3-42 TaxID=2917759 RepID=UPI001EF705C4|nr:hypothetical protein [Ruegeria sp. Ofav3-42]MCG7521476.1 hypothetical protein [Ruegeria sp. Ofav3-42]